VAAVLIVVLSPGLAIVGVIALVALILVLLSLCFGWIMARLRPGRRDPVEQVRRLRRDQQSEPPRRRPAQTSRRRPPRSRL
jgi:hypothetical protein